MNLNTKSRIIAILLLFFVATAFSLEPAANLYTNPESRFQTIEGFGGGLVFNVFPYNHPKKDEIYDSIFNNAGINIVRIGNWYDPVIDSNVKEIPMMLEIQQKWPQVKTMLTSWSPPPYLKSNDSLLGANNATLSKNSDSTYKYNEYADYWLKSIRYFKSKGVRLDWVSIQNEPDWSPNYEGCVLAAVESDSLASYGKALNAVYTKCNIVNNEQITFTGPDVCGVGLERLQEYVTSPDFDKNQISSYAHHYYDYSGIQWMERAGNEFTDKPIYQTEFLVNEDTDWGGIIRTWHFHAQAIHYHLVLENVKMYLLFSLAYKPASTHCLFSLDTLGADWYQARPTYYMFKHFSKSIHRGWQRIAAATDDAAILVSAFANVSNDSSAIVLINTAETPKSIHYVLPGITGEMYQTTDSVKYARIAALTSEETVELPVKSITTFDLHQTGTAIIPRKPVISAGIHINNITATRTGTVLVNFSTPSFPATLSLYDVSGRLIAIHRSIDRGNRTTTGIVLAAKVTQGNYIVVLRSAAATIIKNCIVAY